MVTFIFGFLKAITLPNTGKDYLPTLHPDNPFQLEWIGEWKGNGPENCTWTQQDLIVGLTAIFITTVLWSNMCSLCCYLYIEKPSIDARRVFNRK